MDQPATPTALELQEQMVALVWAFGLHRPDQTPCGQPVGVAEAHALLELSLGAPLAQHELVSRIRLEKSTISRLVQILAQRGWPERSRSATDKRTAELRLTESGRRVAAQIAEARHAKFCRILAALPEGQQTAVIDALRILVESIHDQD